MSKGNLRLWALGLALMLLFAACSKPDPISKIELDPETLSLEIGQEVAIDATVYLASGKVSAAVPVWSTSDETVASVEDGVVIAIAAGEATVTASVGSVSGNVAVTVNAPADPDPEDPEPEDPEPEDPEPEDPDPEDPTPEDPDPEEPEDKVVVEFDEAGPLTLVRTQEFKLSVEVSGVADGADGVIWAVSDSAVVTLSPSLDGSSVTLVAAGVGTAEVSATSKSDEAATATLEVTVESLGISLQLDIDDAVTAGTEGSVTASIVGLFDGADAGVNWSVEPAGAVSFDDASSLNGDEATFTVNAIGEITLIATSVQDSAVSGSVSVTSLDTALDSMNVYVGDWVDSPVAGWTEGTQFNPFASFSDAMNAVADGGTIHLADGTVEVDTPISPKKAFSLIGQSQEGSILDFSGSTTARFEIQSGDVHIQDLTIIGSNPSSGNIYQGLKFQPGTDGDPLENISLTNVTVMNSRNTAIDLHSIDGAVLENVTAMGVTNGVGISISASKDITLNGVHTEDNAWGGLALFGDQDGDYSLTNVENVTVSADSTFDEQVGVYSEMDPGTELIDVTLEGFTHAVRNVAHRTGGERFTFYFTSEADAFAYARFLSQPGASTIQLVSGDVSELGAFQVISGMSIAVAVDAANDGDSIEIHTGNHSIDSTVVIDESITVSGLTGNQVFTNQPTGVTIEVTGSDVRIEGLNFIALNPNADQLAFLYVYGSQPNVVIDGNTFSGTYTPNSPMVVRGMRITATPGAAGMQITNNVFTNIRQPAYIDGPGSADPDVDLLLADNHAVGTRGWVVDSVAMGINFQGNSFENHAALEMISFIGSSHDDYRTMVADVSAANNDAVVKYQLTGGELTLYPPQ